MVAPFNVVPESNSIPVIEVNVEKSKVWCTVSCIDIFSMLIKFVVEGIVASSSVNDFKCITAIAAINAITRNQICCRGYYVITVTSLYIICASGKSDGVIANTSSKGIDTSTPNGQC